jgi:2-polyprenyl-6-methoxyphenol hydroxylase-like FAD-dependent oxidoreductase
MSRPAQIAVVGGGIGGLVAAGCLARSGAGVLLRPRTVLPPPDQVPVVALLPRGAS